MDIEGIERVSAYVAKDGGIVDAQCSGLQVRPYGANSEFPPTAGGGDPDGFIVTVDLGAGGVLEANVTRKLTLVSAEGVYSRYLSGVVGGLKGDSSFSGVGVNEEFTLLPPS